jgi:acetoacetate decarboxylase
MTANLTDKGFSIPLSAPLYPAPPYHYRNAQFVLAAFEASAADVARHLPPGVEPVQDPVPALAFGVWYPFSTFGPYHESAVTVAVTFEGERYDYAPFVYVDGEVPMAAGRELWGAPKKLGAMELSYGASAAGREQYLFTLERPAAKRLMTITMTPQRPADLSGIETHPLLTHSYVPPAEEGGSPRVSQFIAGDLHLRPTTGADGTPDVWAGAASVTMDSRSEQDPIHDLRPVRMLGGTYGTFDLTLPLGRVVKDLLHDA